MHPKRRVFAHFVLDDEFGRKSSCFIILNSFLRSSNRVIVELRSKSVLAIYFRFSEGYHHEKNCPSDSTTKRVEKNICSTMTRSKLRPHAFGRQYRPARNAGGSRK